MKRRLFEIWEQFYYLSRLRGEYFRIRRRSWNRAIVHRAQRSTSGVISIWILVGICLIGLIALGYRYPSVGFSDYVSPSGEFQRGKTMWDWLQLLVTPAILVVLAYYLSRAQKEREIAIARAEKREAALQNYFDYMTKLLLEQNYSDDESFEGAARLIRTRTLTTLEMLDGNQKGHLFRFLTEAGLLNKQRPSFSMERANLKGVVLEPGVYEDVNLDRANLDNAQMAGCNLNGAHMDGILMREADLEEASFHSASLNYILLTRSNLFNADLSKAYMIKARCEDTDLEKALLVETVMNRSNLRGASLRNAQLRGVDLSSSDLSFTNLSGANFEGADLQNVNFYGANLRGANLSKANLTNSNITERQMRQAKSLKDATFPQFRIA